MKPNFSPDFPPSSERKRQEQLTEHQTVDKGHGRITKRHLQASSRLAGHLDWPGLQQVCRIERVTKRAGRETTEIAYAITSLSPQRGNAAQLLAHNRNHWGIENKLHWVRDVTFGEDDCRAKIKHCPQNLAAIRNVALTLMRRAGINENLYALRDFASKPLELLKFLGKLNL